MRLEGRLAGAVWRVRALWALVRARGSSVIALSSGPRRILVVCYGNIYRSAFVAERLKSLAPNLEVRSAGFHPVAGRPAPGRQVALASLRGVDLSAHASSLVAPDDLSWAEVVVLMDRSNWVRLRRMGFDAGKLVWLGALAPGNREIPDPYSMDDDSVDELLGRMADCTARLASVLQKPMPKLD